MRCGLALFIVLSGVALSAQRSAVYDTERQVRLEGAVTRVEWINPSAFVFIDVRDGSGVVENWAVEVGNPIELERYKWTRRSLRIGDLIAVDGTPARGPNRQALARSIMHKTSGKRLFEMPAARSGGAGRAAPAPRWPGVGTERLLGGHRRESARRVNRRQRAHERRRPSCELDRRGSRRAHAAVGEGPLPLSPTNAAQGRSRTALHAARRSATVSNAERHPVHRTARARTHSGVDGRWQSQLAGDLHRRPSAGPGGR